jgi:TrmH family RNA methyltransferase
MTVLRSRANPRVRHWSKLARDGRYRKEKRRALIEGPHLVAALLARGLKPLSLLATEAALRDADMSSLSAKAGLSPVLVAENVFRGIVDAETPQGIAAEIEIPRAQPDPEASCVFLEGVQDAGNVGAIIRSAAAFGIGSVVVDRACADPWSPKVLRAGMGGHFSLQIGVVASLEVELERFQGRMICTVPKGGQDLHKADLAGRLGWLFGSEGRGVSPQLQEKAAVRVAIPTSAGTESLNVAAAAAICLYEAYGRSQ